VVQFEDAEALDSDIGSSHAPSHLLAFKYSSWVLNKDKKHGLRLHRHTEREPVAPIAR
jgi:hypothetical protein